jgi:hypothetical protein
MSTLAAVLLDEDPEVAGRYRRTLIDAIDEVHHIARNLGLDPDRLVAWQAPFAVRADAWLCRTDRLLRLRPDK